MKIDGGNFGPCIVFIAFCLLRKLLVKIANIASCAFLSRPARLQLASPCAAGAIRNICVPAPKLVPIRLQTRDRTPDSIFQDVGEAQRQPHPRRWAWEATEVASQSLQDSDLPFGRRLVRQPRRTRYADSSEELGNGTESGAWRETQRP